MVIRALLVVLLAVWGGSAQASSGDVVLRLNQTAVVVGETVQLELQLPSSEARVESLETAPPQSLQRAGSSNNVSIVNGRMSQSYTQNFRLTPTQPGVIVLGPARVSLHGRILISNAVKLVVQGAGVERELALAVTAEPSTVWEGQPFVLRTTIRHGAGFRPVEFTPPAADGIERFSGQTELGQQTDSVQDNSAVFSQLTVLDWRVPHGLGTLELAGGSVELERTGQRNRRLDPFRGFFGAGRSSFSQPLPIVRIQVRALPELDEGHAFSGLVGQASTRWQVSSQRPDRMKAVLHVTGTGSAGNFALKGWTQDGYRIYPDTAQVKQGLNSAGVPAFDIRVPVTLVPGARATSGVPVWFDTQAGQYRPWVLPQSLPPAPKSTTASASQAPTHATAADPASDSGRTDPDGAEPWLLRGPSFTAAHEIAVAVTGLGGLYLTLLAVGRLIQHRKRRQLRPLAGKRLAWAVRLALLRDKPQGWVQLQRQLERSTDPHALHVAGLIGAAVYAPNYSSPAPAVRSYWERRHA